MRLHDEETGVRCAAIGHNISRILITIHVQKLDNELSSGFHSVMIIENLISTLEFIVNHDSQIDN